VSCGYDVDAALDGMQAMMQLNKFKPHLVLLDISMPAGGGLTVLKNIRQNMKLFNTPVIILSALSDDKTREVADKLGISGYFVKPADMDMLKERISEILDKD
jgi:DNA-binding response OmpR family regulator